MRALINFGNRINIIQLTYIIKLGLYIKKIYINIQKIYKLYLDILDIIIANLSTEKKLDNILLFQNYFL